MKKIIFSMLAAMMTLTSMAQSNIWYWKNGEATKVVAVDSVTFEAPAVPHEYVDLGLSVKWATMNVGATKPEEFGDYFAWGETAAKENYTRNTYKWMEDGGSTLSKYNNTDNKTVLDAEDDAATVNWGGAWRMPTKAEQDELITNCTWTWTNDYNGTGVRGYEVKATNGNSIFLPATGYRYGNALGQETSGLYWLADMRTAGSYISYYLHFYSALKEVDTNYRYLGFTVRPVCP